MSASKSRRARREEARRAGKLARADVDSVLGSLRCACGALALKRGGPTQGFLCHNGHWFGAEELAKGESSVDSG